MASISWQESVGHIPHHRLSAMSRSTRHSIPYVYIRFVRRLDITPVEQHSPMGTPNAPKIIMRAKIIYPPLYPLHPYLKLHWLLLSVHQHHRPCSCPPHHTQQAPQVSMGGERQHLDASPHLHTTAGSPWGPAWRTGKVHCRCSCASELLRPALGSLGALEGLQPGA